MKKITLALSLLISTSLFAADANPRMVSVSGECNHMVSPDRGSITLTVEYLNMDLAKATREAADSYERVSSAVKKLKLDNFNMRTSEYSVSQVMEWQKDHQVMKGYRVRMGLWVSTSETNKLGEVIAIASREKVKEVNSLQTYLSDERQMVEEIACLQEASANARVKAQKLASALGASLGEVITVNESGVSRPFFQPQREMMMRGKAMSMAMDAAAPNIEAGQQNLSLSVQVTFGLK